MADATNSAGGPRSAPDSMRKFTERQVSAALRLARLELYLVAADLRIGRHDPLTHLKVFTVDEVERIAARLGLPPPRLEEQLAEESAPEDNALLGRCQDLPANKTRRASRLGNEQERMRQGTAVPRKPCKRTRFYYADCFSARSTSFKQRSARSRSAPSSSPWVWRSV